MTRFLEGKSSITVRTGDARMKQKPDRGLIPQGRADMTEMEVLERVLTVTEVCQMWCRSRGSVVYALGSRRNPLVFRPSTSGYLILYASCVRRWGPPVTRRI